MGLLFALSICFSYIESLMVIPGLPPGIRLGLSNIITMYGLFFLGGRSAYTLAIMKACFVMLTRGLIAGLLSASGGIFSVTAMALLLLVRKNTFGYPALSVVGAVFHNIGQLLVARVITNVFLFYYIPVLLVSGVVVGTVTGLVFRLVLPHIPAVYKDKRLRHPS